MTDVADVRRRVRAAIERAKREASERRSRAEADAAVGQQFIRHVATPVAKQLSTVLRAEGFFFRLSTPAGAVRLVSESQREDFIELSVDTTQDPVTILTVVNHVRGHRVSTRERPLRAEVSLESLTEADVLDFLVEALPVFVER
ncbi:MAG: hypothetical protein VYE68_06235 [Acidobacteriota bacterium]|nr:hypothetical protein [Acidobacteriota bacterium]